jgi:RNA polymerase sigma-70 factor (ECF subfamily)
MNAAMPAGPTRDFAAALPALRVRLLRHARLALRDQGLAEDLVQDTLLAMLQQRDHRGEASLATWAVAILRHKIADWYRSPLARRVAQQRDDSEMMADDVEALFDDDGHYVEPVAPWQQPENRHEQRQMMSVLERCVARLPPQTGRVFMMREWLGFDTAEICERLLVSADNVRTMLHRARMSLRECMQHHWLGASPSR